MDKPKVIIRPEEEIVAIANRMIESDKFTSINAINKATGASKQRIARLISEKKILPLQKLSRSAVASLHRKRNHNFNGWEITMKPKAYL